MGHSRDAMVSLDVRVQVHRLGDAKVTVSSERYEGELSTPREEVEDYFIRKYLAPGEVVVRRALYDDTCKDCWSTLDQYLCSLRDMSGNTAVPCTMQIVVDGCGGHVACDGPTARSSDTASAEWYRPRRPAESTGGADIAIVPGGLYNCNEKYPCDQQRPTICDQPEHRLRHGLNQSYRSIYDAALAEHQRLKEKDAAQREDCRAHLEDAGYTNCKLVDDMYGYHPKVWSRSQRPRVQAPTHYGGTNFRGSTRTSAPMVGTVGHPGPYRYPVPHTVSTAPLYSVGRSSVRASTMQPREFLVKSEQSIVSGSE